MRLTKKEKFILKNIDINYRYIARDFLGNLYVYKEKPFKNYRIDVWQGWDFSGRLTIFNHLFKSIKWNNRKPLMFRNEEGEFIL